MHTLILPVIHTATGNRNLVPSFKNDRKTCTYFVCCHVCLLGRQVLLVDLATAVLIALAKVELQSYAWLNKVNNAIKDAKYLNDKCYKINKYGERVYKFHNIPCTSDHWGERGSREGSKTATRLKTFSTNYSKYQRHSTKCPLSRNTEQATNTIRPFTTWLSEYKTNGAWPPSLYWARLQHLCDMQF